MKHSFLFLILLQSCTPVFAASERAAWQGIPSDEFEMADYPAPGSPAFVKDFEVLLEDQKTRTPQQCREGERMKRPRFSTLFRSEILGPAEMALVTPLMDRVTSFTERVSNYYKDRFDRVRPYNTDSRVKPCVEKPTGARSYPSSHAAIASAVSCLLAEVFPDKESDLKTYGQELGELRVIIGVHHPSDVKAGQKLGSDVCQRLMSEPDFKEELKDLKKSAHDL